MFNPGKEERLLIHNDPPDATPVGAKRQSGQSLFEFAVILPVLLIILAGLLDLGRLYYAYVAVTDVAGEGAGYAAAFLPSSGGPCPDYAAATAGCLHDPSDEEYRKNEYRRDLHCTCQRAYAATSGLVQGDELDVVVTIPSGTTFGSQITVTVHYSHALVTPLLNAIVPGGALPLTAYATERVVDPSTE
jgi:Flp pilus assembly protein TadG